MSTCLFIMYRVILVAMWPRFSFSYQKINCSGTGRLNLLPCETLTFWITVEMLYWWDHTVEL